MEKKMNRKRRFSGMIATTIIMAVLAIIFILIGYLRGQGQHISGLRTSLNMTIQILPLLIFSFIVAGMAQSLISKEIIANWIGAESGIKGIIIGTAAGSLVPGGPYVALPLSAGFLGAGASIGTVVAFLTGWSLWGFSRLPLEVGILGWKFALIRFVSTFIFAPIAGFIAQIFFGNIK
jgi:uncharacterized membrane protein YraQ (UPF0718 family)